MIAVAHMQVFAGYHNCQMMQLAVWTSSQSNIESGRILNIDVGNFMEFWQNISTTFNLDFFISSVRTLLVLADRQNVWSGPQLFFKSLGTRNAGELLRFTPKPSLDVGSWHVSFEIRTSKQSIFQFDSQPYPIHIYVEASPTE